MNPDIKPYPELPLSWTIAREEFWNGRRLVSKWYGLHKSDKETLRYKSYGEALNAVEQQELLC